MASDAWEKQQGIGELKELLDHKSNREYQSTINQNMPLRSAIYLSGSMVRR